MLSYGAVDCKKRKPEGGNGVDELLLRRAQSGDPDAFRQLMEPLEQLVWRVCWHYTGNREAAEDCGQEAMPPVRKSRTH